MQGLIEQPINTRLLQENRRNLARIEQLEKENRALKELVSNYRKDHAARYERNAKKERWHIENLEYMIAGSAIVAALFGAVYAMYGFFSYLWGWAC